MIDKRMLALGLSILVICLYVSQKAMSTPLFSMQSAQNCQTCHVMPDKSDPKWNENNYAWRDRKCRLSCGACHINPSGGMLRNTTGYYFGQNVLSFTAHSSSSPPAYVQYLGSKTGMSFGGDFRMLTLYDDNKDKNPLIFPMQADFYMAFKPIDHIEFFSQAGMERGGNAAVREAFGMVRDLPYNSYVKMGKFIPPYGHRLEDHTAFIRTKVNFDHSQPQSYPSGVEVGTEPILFFTRFAAFNQDVTPAANTDTTQRGVSATAGWRGLWLHLGGSYFDMINYETTIDQTTDRQAYGVFGALRFKFITYLFEFDKRVDQLIDPTGSTTDEDAYITFNEINVKVHQGCNVKFRYETFNADDLPTQDDEYRVIAGVDLYPIAFTEINLQYRGYKKLDERDDRYLALFHLWF